MSSDIAPLDLEYSGDLWRRQCSSTTTYNGRLGLRISSVPVVFVASLIGVMFPLVSSRVKKLNMPPLVYFFAKYFGSGVIFGTSFVHLLYEAVTSLSDKCLPLAFHQFPYSIGIALVSMFFTFWIEITTRYIIRKRNGGKDIPHTHGPSGLAHRHSHSHDNEQEEKKEEENSSEVECDNSSNEVMSETIYPENLYEEPDKKTEIHTFPMATSTIPNQELQAMDAETILRLQRSATVNAEARLTSQIATICLLEFGVVFHSIFVGLTLAVTNLSFPTLYVVICFHQMFEGMGLGSRLAETPWGKKNEWVPWTFAIAFALTTPIGIAIGLGVRNTYPPGSAHALITNGVFDSISAGILIYTSLVELMGVEFLYSDEFQEASYGTIMLAFGFMCLGCGLMSMLGRWA
ncbi:uncharacterized protein SAPINGB_P006426 [Magnusiomyces paraingens]|uniref:Zinc/iron permease n=1 Tax=Magnusiomyces paraingens TaxID=2606893 RepID=A0A5E8C9X1_9ASCO|nr:uncharacterized protein SAPINGB_P006426 [Saprochaete ingens]VVT58871.1 unnamed protein product [Saprochaete ingens]